MYKVILSILLFLSFGSDIHCQVWPKVYLINSPNFGYVAIQSYDQGFVIGGQLFNWDGTNQDGFIYKTNINGDILWNKTFTQPVECTSIFDINQTSDGGLISVCL